MDVQVFGQVEIQRECDDDDGVDQQHQRNQAQAVVQIKVHPMTNSVFPLLHVQQDGLQLVHYSEDGGHMKELMAVTDDVEVTRLQPLGKVGCVEKCSNSAKDKLASMQSV